MSVISSSIDWFISLMLVLSFGFLFTYVSLSIVGKIKEINLKQQCNCIYAMGVILPVTHTLLHIGPPTSVELFKELLLKLFISLSLGIWIAIATTIAQKRRTYIRKAYRIIDHQLSEFSPKSSRLANSRDSRE